MIDAEKVETLLDRGSGITSISGGLAAELQEKFSNVELTRPFVGKQGLGQFIARDMQLPLKLCPLFSSWILLGAWSGSRHRSLCFPMNDD